MGVLVTAPNSGKRQDTDQIVDAALKALNLIKCLFRFRFHIRPLLWLCCPGVSFAQFPQEFIRWYEERVLLKHAADDDHRVRPHDVYDDLPAKLGEIVYSYDRVFIPRQNVVQPRLIFHQVIDARPVLQGPIHMGNQASEREPLPDAALKHLFY